jgi:hypothetical protein
MTALLLAIVVGNVNMKHACYVAEQFRNVNVPLEPAVSSTEVVKTAAVIGPSNTLLGSALTLRNGKRYFADVASQQPRSKESYALLRAIGVVRPEPAFAGTLWPLKHALPAAFRLVSCP